ncbi:MAG: tetratricopeptide repeat protein [Flavobacteriales bacterium]|nr:tetratricopeptide repeat protein [Flavobacteriales bacterium]
MFYPKQLLLLFFTLNLFQYSLAQNFADKDYYIVDSLEVDKISENDKLLIDSCLVLFHNAKHDTDKINAITIIVEESWDDSVWPKYNMWLYHFLKKSLTKQNTKLAKQNLLKSLAGTINNIGFFYNNQGDIKNALKYYEESLKIEKEIGNKEGIAQSLNNIAIIYKNQGDIETAINLLHQSLKIQEEIGNQEGIAQGLNNLGGIYNSQGEKEKALEYFHKSLKLEEKGGNKQGIAIGLNNLGYIYNSQIEEFLKKKSDPKLIDRLAEKAIDYYLKSQTIYFSLGNKKGIAGSYINIGIVYNNQSKNLTSSTTIKDKKEKALEYYKKSLKIFKLIEDKEGSTYALNCIASVLMDLNRTAEAVKYAEQSLVIAEKIGFPANISATANLLSNLYEKQNKGMKALAMHRLFINMRDSINNDKNLKATIKQQAKYDYEKDKAIDDAEHDNLIAIEQKEKEKQKIISYATAVGLILVIVFLLFVFNRLKITRKQKLVIEEQTKEIVDSITYAKRIQEAILPTHQFVKECLPESFIYYKPKDIVAGDFYWVDKKGGNILFAAADCTGHGVPGAMVSVVCHNAMDRAIREYNLTVPGQILDKTREIVVDQLNKEISIDDSLMESIRDGMDIALCVLNTKTNELNYAGAYNPLWILRKGADKIEEIKANRQSIGKVDKPLPYTTHQISLNKGDTIYLFSDGYADQFGGEKGKKMMYKPFKNLLLSLKNEPMENQLQTLSAHFESWKGDLEQIDDVCIIGVRI